MIMENEKADKQQVFSKLCSNLGTPLPMILSLFLISFLVFFSISKSFLSFLLTIPIALLSTLFLVTLTKKKGSQDEKLVQDKLQKEELQSPLDVTHTENNQQSETAESHEMQAEEEQSNYSFPSDSESSNFLVMDKNFELNAQKHEQQAVSQSDSSLPSDSESNTSSIMCESFEIDHYGNQNVSSSDSLAFDNYDYEEKEEEEEEEEDSLIEINLPSSHFSGFTEEPERKWETELPDFLQESIFKEQALMELLAEINEMNEDENLIEIDISMGSTNSQDFRLKQELAQLGDQCVLSE